MLAPFIKGEKLKEIDLGGNRITLQGLKTLLKVCSRIKSIRLIKFQNNNLDTDFSLKTIKEFEQMDVKILF